MRIHIQFNHQTGFYEATESGIIYQMDLAEMDSLKKTRSPTVADWYLSQPLSVRARVRRIGMQHKAEDDFYPDIEQD